MIDEGKFGIQEGLCLTTITIASKVFYTSPGRVVSIVGNTGWYMTLISMGIAMLGFTSIYLLLKSFPNKDIVAIFDATLGNILGFVFSAILGLYLLFIATNTVAEFTGVVNVYVFPLTPPSIIIGIFTLGILVLSILGLEVLARLAKLFVYIIIFGFLLTLALGAKDYDINRLFPFFGYGADKVLKNGIIRSSAYGEVIILAVFATALQGTSFIKKVGYSSLILSGIVISLSTLAFSLSFPYYTAQELMAPMYEMAMLIDYGRFVQRVEPIFLFIWFLSSFITVSILFYCFISIYCKMFKVQDIKPIALGSAIIFFGTTIIQSNLGIETVQSVQTIRQYGWGPPFILPLIALVIGLLRRRGEKSSA